MWELRVANVHTPACRLSSAKKLGVTEVSLEVVNFISHATQSRLRSLLEKVSAVAQHRTDGGKARNTRTARQRVAAAVSPMSLFFCGKHEG